MDIHGFPAWGVNNIGPTRWLFWNPNFHETLDWLFQCIPTATVPAEAEATSQGSAGAAGRGLEALGETPSLGDGGGSPPEWAEGGSTAGDAANQRHSSTTGEDRAAEGEGHGVSISVSKKYKFKKIRSDFLRFKNLKY